MRHATKARSAVRLATSETIRVLPDKIAAGSLRTDLPVQRSSKFELIIKTPDRQSARSRNSLDPIGTCRRGDRLASWSGMSIHPTAHFQGLHFRELLSFLLQRTLRGGFGFEVSLVRFDGIGSPRSLPTQAPDPRRGRVALCPHPAGMRPQIPQARGVEAVRGRPHCSGA